VSCSGSFVLAVSRRHIVWAAVFFVSVRGAFGMIGGIFDAFHRGRFDCLIRVGQVLDRVFGAFRFIRKAEGTDTLPSAVCSDFSRIVSKIIELSFEIAFQFRRPLVVGVSIFSGHSLLPNSSDL